MKMKKLISLMLCLIMVFSTVTSIAAPFAGVNLYSADNLEAAEISRISLANNLSYYNSTVPDGTKLVVDALDASGKSVDITGKTVTFESERPWVVDVNKDGTLIDNGYPGSTRITATVDGVTGGFFLIKTDGDGPGFFNRTYLVYDEDEVYGIYDHPFTNAGKGYIYKRCFNNDYNSSTGRGSSALAKDGERDFDGNPQTNTGHYANITVGGGNVDWSAYLGYRNLPWETEGSIRMSQFWFYDDGTSALSVLLNMAQSKAAMDSIGHTVLPAWQTNDSVGYYWQGNLSAAEGSDTYTTTAPTVSKNPIKRTVGWHQATTVVDENGEIKAYIDGEELLTAKFAASNAAGSVIQIQAKSAGKFDDFVICGNPNTERPEGFGEELPPVSFDSEYETLYETDFSEHADEIVGTDLSHAQLTQMGAGYVKSGEDIYYYQSSNAALLSKWISPVGNNNVSGDFSGEYAIDYRAMYANYPFQQSTGSLSSFITYDSSDLNKSFMGYKIAWDVSGTSTVSFKYRYKDVLDTAVQVGTWDFTSGEWYTYRQVYNFDNMTAELYITDSSGNQVGYFKHDLQSEVNGTAIPYKDVVTSSMYSESSRRGLIQVSDYTFEKRIAVPVTASFNEEKVDVTYGDEPIKSGEKVFIAYNSDAKSVFNIKAEDGVTIDKILVNDKEIDVTSSIELVSVTEGQYIEIITDDSPAEEPPAEEPAASEYFVATNGSDDNPGTIDAPFATIEKARDTIRAMSSKPDGGITVNIRGGTYRIRNTINFVAEDSGTESCPIVYQAYNDEKVSFVGGQQLDTGKIEKVTDEVLLDRLVEEGAKDHLYSLDLRAQGIEMSPVDGNGWYDFPVDAPNEIFMNGTRLTRARWPNDDESQMLIKAKPFTGADLSKYNKGSSPIMMTYPDKEDRTNRWQFKSNDMLVGGAIAFAWACAELRIDELNAEEKWFTTSDRHVYGIDPSVVGWGPQYKIYFANIFEEIDKPGESYVDREKGILYFYPVGKTDGGEMFVSTLQKTMLEVSGASYITFKGLDFKDSRATLVKLYASNNINILDGSVSGSASPMGILFHTCTDIKVAGNHIYSIGGDAIQITNCGDRLNVATKPANVVIENNNIHGFSYNYGGSGGKIGIFITNSAGVTIRNNEISDFPVTAILPQDSNDILIEYNKIHHGSLFATDNGSIYWGRDASSYGNIVRYNHFEEIGSTHANRNLHMGTTGSLFVDDGGTGPEMYGNIFVDGGIGCDLKSWLEGGYGTLSWSTNTGIFFNCHDNIIIRKSDDRSQVWGTLTTWHIGERFSYEEDGKTVDVDPRTSINTFSKMIGAYKFIYPNATDNALSEARQKLLFSDEWKEHYKGTNWERATNFYTRENYEKALEFKAAGDKDGYLKWVNETFPKEHTNVVNNNVIIGDVEQRHGPWDPKYYSDFATVDAQKNYFADLESGAELFENFDGNNYNITDEGLAKIRTVATDFDAPDFDKIGLYKNGKGEIPGGVAPSAKIKAELVNGIAEPGNIITPAYEFFDADGDAEGNSEIYWYVADEENGTYEMVRDQATMNFVVGDEHGGKYLKYEVIPYDQYSLRGEKVTSAPIAVRKVEIKAESIALDTNSLELDVGDTYGVKATVTPDDATNKNVIWSSSDEDVATVENGVVTAKAAGTAVITATTADGGYAATCTVKVNKATVAVTGILLDKTSATLTVGDSEILKVTVLPSDATNKNVIWSSSDKNVATVENGVVTANSEGTAVITAISEDGGFIAECEVVVKDNEPDTNAPKVSLAKAKFVDRNTVTLDVMLDNNTGFASLGIELEYDSDVMTLTAVENEPLVGGNFAMSQNISDNPVNLSWYNTSNITYNGKIATLTFAISEDAPAGTYPVSVSYYKGVRGDYEDGSDVNFDENDNPLGLVYKNGSIKVYGYMPGDIDGDGKINAKDAITMIRYLAGWKQEACVTDALDTNGDTKVNAKDAIWLFKYLAGWDVELH